MLTLVNTPSTDDGQEKYIASNEPIPTSHCSSDKGKSEKTITAVCRDKDAAEETYRTYDGVIFPYNLHAMLGDKVKTLFITESELPCDVLNYNLHEAGVMSAVVTTVLYGRHDTGKSTTLDVYKALLGEENITGESLAALTLSDYHGDYARARLDGKIVNIASDIRPVL